VTVVDPEIPRPWPILFEFKPAQAIKTAIILSNERWVNLVKDSI
jgi:hypothetical protein